MVNSMVSGNSIVVKLLFKLLFWIVYIGLVKQVDLNNQGSSDITKCVCETQPLFPLALISISFKDINMKIS